MTLKDYLVNRKLSPTSWAKSQGIVPELIIRFINGKRGLSAATMAKIVEATGGEVSYEDLVQEMLARRGGNREQ